MPPRAIIGKGTWMDKVAFQVLERERRLGRSTSLVNVESGLGASGIPHIGNLSDPIRAYGIKMALEVQGVRSHHIAYIDDMDGLRKVPAGLPSSPDLNGYLAHPVSRIPDPFRCHGSYGEHMGGLLRDAMEKVGIEYEYQSAAVNYGSGRFLPLIRTVLSRSEEVGKAIRELSGQEKYEGTLPYFAICPNCGRIYTTQASSFDRSTDTVHFKCSGTELRGRRVEGCGYEGDTKLSSGEGKLSWKVEFAVRWCALDIRYEAHGKELTTSVKVNDWVSDNVLFFPHPYHVKYELFLDRAGKKFSKSEGALLTPQTWFRYASGSSLVLLMFKRIVGSRSISIDDIPKYMDELDRLEEIYHGKRVAPRGAGPRLKGLYEYVTFMKPPPPPLSQHVPYRLLADLARVAPSDRYIEYVLKRLSALGYTTASSKDLDSRITMARNWALDIQGVSQAPPQEQFELNEDMRRAVLELAEKITSTSTPDEIQEDIFETARNHSIPTSNFFRTLYRLLLGQDRGPRLGPYICDAGSSKVAEKLRSAVGGAEANSTSTTGNATTTTSSS